MLETYANECKVGGASAVMEPPDGMAREQKGETEMVREQRGETDPEQ